MKGDSLQVRPSTALIKAVKRILFSLVHLLLKFGITFPQLSEMLKEIYIDVANRHFRLDNKKPTQTRLSFLTGVHRKDVKRIQSSSENKEEPENVSVGVRLVSSWLTESKYLDENGKPLILPLKSKASSSFEQLVQIICKQDIRPRVILDEWLNLGVVRIIDEKNIKLCTDAFIPQKGLDEKSFFLGQNISDHLNAASNNLLTDSPPFLERCVYYDDLSEEAVTELQTLAQKHAMELLVKLNERASQLKKQDTDKDGAKHRINIGVYLYHEEKNRNK